MLTLRVELYCFFSIPANHISCFCRLQYLSLCPKGTSLTIEIPDNKVQPSARCHQMEHNTETGPNACLSSCSRTLRIYTNICNTTPICHVYYIRVFNNSAKRKTCGSPVSRFIPQVFHILFNSKQEYVDKSLRKESKMVQTKKQHCAFR